MTPSGVLCVGTVTVDQLKRIDHLPQLESLVLIDELIQSTGGPGLNIAFNLRQLDQDLPVEAIGCLAHDAGGEFILEQTKRMNIDHDHMQWSTKNITSFSDALTLNSNGKRTFLFHSGTNDDLDLSKVDISSGQSNFPRILHLGAPGLHKLADSPTQQHANQWVEILQRAQGHGIKTNMEMVFLDPQRSRELVLPCLPHLTSLIINESEAAALLGTEAKVENPDSIVDWNQLERLAAGLISLGVNEIAVIHTPAGAVAADFAGGTYQQGSVKVPAKIIKGTTGAGDAFAAGVVYGLHEGWSIQDCLKLGVATSAQNIQSTFTALEVKPAAQTLAAADAFGYRE